MWCWIGALSWENLCQWLTVLYNTCYLGLNHEYEVLGSNLKVKHSLSLVFCNLFSRNAFKKLQKSYVVFFFFPERYRIYILGISRKGINIISSSVKWDHKLLGTKQQYLDVLLGPQWVLSLWLFTLYFSPF